MTRITSRRAATFAFAILAVPGLAACGSDTNDALEEAKTAASAAAASAESASAVAESALEAVEDVADTAGDVVESALAVVDTAAEAAESAAASADSAADTAAASSGGGSNPDSDYCKKVKTTAAAFSGLDDVEPQNFGDLIAALEKAGTEVSEVAEVAPDSIKGDWKAMADVITDAAEALAPFKDLDLSDPTSIDPAKLAELETIGPKLESLGTTIESSQAKIDDVTQAECGFKLDDLD